MYIPKELKEAISNLPSLEKDKLIFKLLKKDLVLANRLLFELVNTNTIDQQRKIVEKSIITQARRMSENFYSVGYLNLDVRFLSGEINEHVSITKDKFGEVSLNLIMINEILKRNKTNILNQKESNTKKFCTAVIARAFKIVLLINKLDDDFFIEFKEDLITLGKHISENHYLMNSAIRNGFDVNWLLNAEIPENIIQIHKEVRDLGFL